MDFYRTKEQAAKNGVIHVYPDFRVCRSKDLMVRGRSFYAIWDEEVGLWSTDEYDVQRLVDNELLKYQDEVKARSEGSVQAKLLSDFSSNSWLQFRNYVGHLSDSSHQLDNNLTFSNTEVKKTDYVSRRLPYPLTPGDHSAWDEIVGTLYDPEERAKIEWAIGAIVSGDSKHIQKFLVFYGSAGTGKSTILNIIANLFEGYTATFEAKALTSNSNAFATEVFKSNPLVAIQHDGDLSKIEDNTKLNSIVSHEIMSMNEKYKPSYDSIINAFLLMGTNSAVKITDSKSGIIRRLIDVRPTGNKVSPRRYQTLMGQINFELGAIASHCLDIYRSMGKDYYSGYIPVEMMLQTDVFFNYIEANYDIFRDQDGATLTQAYDLYKIYCEDSLIEYKLAKYKFREELKNYFNKFEERAEVDGVRVRSWYSGFNASHFKVKVGEEQVFSLVMDDDVSLLDSDLASMPAQYSKEDGTPQKFWTNEERMDGKGNLFTPKPNQIVSTVLSDLDTSKEHYVKPPLNHIVIDFDLTGPDGNKSAERNLEAASTWPSTYAEFSKSGEGIHLHYNYTGDASELSRVYDDGIEIKVFTGNSSLRRRMSKCNNVPVASISSGLPLKEKKMMNGDSIKSEKSLRDLIERNLRKEIHPGTKSSVDFIHKILDDAYYSGLSYDVTDMRAKILAFANNSTNQGLYSIKRVMDMKFKSATVEPNPTIQPSAPKEERLVIFDVEVFPNLFVVCWKYKGDANMVKMINPSAQAIEELLNLMLVGFNCRRYDNHILYAAFMGYNNEQLYQLSKKIINNVPNALFGEAYNLSYTDIYDFSSAANKKGLKKWEIELGLRHVENQFPWDEPVDEKDWLTVVEYCCVDVENTEIVLDHLASDFLARKILADLSGLTVNDTTNAHSSRIIFGTERKPQSEFVYTDLSDMFPGYKFDKGKSFYRDEETGEGGYVYGEPGMYSNVALLDVESMHPTSIEQLDLFGSYTKRFSEIKNARMAIKHGDLESARLMLEGKLAKHLEDESKLGGLSDALKTVINSVYGLTSAKFTNSFKDPRNIDNIVAKRGALFMVDLKHAVQEQGFIVAHIKTDSIKIPNATPEIIEFVMEFGQKYGYNFEHEATYEKMCLINNAVYIAKTKPGRKPAKWTATGAQFAHPFVYKTLFSHEKIEFKDMCEAKFVTTALYLDFDSVNKTMVNDGGKPHFVGKAGLFCPVKEGSGGGILLREKDGKYHAAAGSTGYLWMEAEMVKNLGKAADIDRSYFTNLVDEATDVIAKYGDAEWFVS